MLASAAYGQVCCRTGIGGSRLRFGETLREVEVILTFEAPWYLALEGFRYIATFAVINRITAKETKNSVLYDIATHDSNLIACSSMLFFLRENIKPLSLNSHSISTITPLT